VEDGDKWTILPRIVCVEYPHHTLFEGLSSPRRRPPAVAVGPEAIRNRYPKLANLTHTKLEEVAALAELYRISSKPKFKFKFIEAVGNLVNSPRPYGRGFLLHSHTMPPQP